MNELDIFDAPDEVALAMIDNEAALISLDGLDETAQVASEEPMRIFWNKKSGIWETDAGPSTILTITNLALRRQWAEWSDVLGEPKQKGWGPAPEGMDSGYAFVMQTVEFGPVFGELFGIGTRSISAAAKVFTRTGEVRFSGSFPVKTSHGLFYGPKVG